jgi:hypothetical protein
MMHETSERAQTLHMPVMLIINEICLATYDDDDDDDEWDHTWDDDGDEDDTFE